MIKAVITASLTGLASALTLPDPGFSQTQPNGIAGSWRVLEVAGDSAGRRITRTSVPGLYLFTQRHYSITRIDSSEPRPDFPSEVRQTVDTYREIWGPFVAQAGTYEVNGDRIITRPLVSKNPAGMQPGVFNSIRWRMVADTLWLHTIANHEGATPDGIVVKLLRDR